jgi:hypothetical protein
VAAIFEALDFLYMPSRDPAAQLAHFETALGAEVVFAIAAFDTRVAMLRLGDGPALLLAGHLEGDRPVLVYRVAELEAAIERLAGSAGTRFEIPFGPGCEVTVPGGHRLAIYQRTRPEMSERLGGRRDF